MIQAKNLKELKNGISEDFILLIHTLTQQEILVSFYLTIHLDKILKISWKEEQKTSDNERIKEDFNTYKFSSDFIDPIEEFVFPECAFTNHWLFCLTHSPSFENLRVIDLRRNPINSLLLLKQYYSEMRVPMLEELYLDTQVYDDIYNTKLIVLFNKNGEIFFLF